MRGEGGGRCRGEEKERRIEIAGTPSSDLLHSSAYTSSPPYARLHLFRLHVAHVREKDGEGKVYIHIHTYITRRFPHVIPSKVAAAQAAF